MLTSHPHRYAARDDRDFLRPHLANPHTDVQKAGHGSLVETGSGEWYIAHLSARPLPGTLRSVLGRETSLQKVRWTAHGWLELAAGGVLAGSATEAPAGPPVPDRPPVPATVRDDFDGPALLPDLATLRVPATPDWADLTSRPGWLRVRGRDSLFSRFSVSLVAVRLQGFTATATTLVDFTPEHLRIYASERLGGRALGILEAEGGRRREHLLHRVLLPDGPVTLRADVDVGELRFSWSVPGVDRVPIGPVLDVSRLADEPLRGFTGTMVGITCQDAARRTAFADFDHLTVAYPEAAGSLLEGARAPGKV